MNEQVRSQPGVEFVAAAATGTLTGALAIEAAIDLLPFGKMLKKVKGAYRAVRKAKIVEADEVIKQIAAKTAKDVGKEGLGEAGVIIAAKVEGFNSTDLPARHHGIDSILGRWKQVGDRRGKRRSW